MNWNYAQPVPILFGNGRIKELGEEVRKLNKKKGLLITSHSFVTRGIALEILKESEGLLAAVYGEISPNPDITECQTCVDLLKEINCDFVVALGGGSVLDCAKAAAAIAASDLPVSAYLEGEPVPSEALSLIAVPTTAGTGSEVTSVAVLSDHARGLKKPLAGNALYPSLAIVDPELTVTMPPFTTACTGMDAFCHSLEAYWSIHHQPICDALAVYALKLILQNIRIAYREPENREAREKMAEASLIAGLAFTIPKTTAPHACSYPLTSMFDIAHGEACALTIDWFLRLNAKEDKEGRLQRLAEELGFTDCKVFAEEIVSLKKDLGLRRDLKDLGIDEETFERLVQGSTSSNLFNNPVTVTEEHLRQLYRSLL
ncbi:MAG: iron-containing alcohol dehydrogenase [Erysipelotrichaceae bacterium]|nr:iron-containing alcohol dehydrogenase [Erysipelotrichaceae bacterium]